MGHYLDAKLAVHHTLHRISHRLEQEAKDKKQAATNSDLLFHPPFTREKLKAPMLANLVELHKDLDGELRGQLPAGDHVVQRLGEAVADGGPPVQLDGGHPLQHTVRK
jgi:hypothetical protein